jgi:hypothetical protein
MRSLLLATVALTTASHVAAAQIFHSPETARTSRGGWSVDVGGRMAQPVGEFSENVNRAWGGGVAVRYHFGWFPVLGVRADLGLLNYGSERKRVPLSPTLNRVLVEMNTSNNIALVTAGPELALRRGPVRPYLYGFGGYSHFYTESSARDQDGGHAIASSVNFSDGGGTVGWGGGVRIPFKARRATASFDAGARFTRNWTRTYLRPGDIQDQPDGSLQFNQRRSRADFWQFHLGASFSPRRSGR